MGNTIRVECDILKLNDKNIFKTNDIVSFKPSIPN